MRGVPEPVRTLGRDWALSNCLGMALHVLMQFLFSILKT